MAKRKQINIALVGFTLFMTFVVLGIVIATLVKVYQKPASNVNDESDGLSGKPNIVNIPSDVSITSQAGKKYDAYKSYVKTLQDSLNTSVNPCDDFFLYTCGNLQGQMSFYSIQYNNMLAVAKHARKDQSTKSRVAQQAAYHFKKCVEAHKDPKQIHGDGKTIAGIYTDFKNRTGLTFPVFQSSWTGSFPDANTFSKTLGILTGIYGVDTFISLQVDTNWEHPSDTGINSYEIYIDQTSLVFDGTYYTKAWEFIKEDYKNETLDILTKIAGYTKSTLDTSNLDSDVDDMLNLEHYIANNINTSPDIRRKYDRQVNQQTIPDATKAHPNIDFKTYLNFAMTYASGDAADVVNAGGFKINLNEEDQLSNLIKYITNSTNVKPRTIYNYLFFRVLRANKNLLPDTKKSLTDEMIRNDNKQLGRKGRDRWRKLPREHFSELTDDEKIDITCAQENAVYLWYINARFFVEELLPTEKQRTELKSNVAALVASVLEGFQNQLDILDWMKESTKQGAYSKIKYLVRNIAYPDKIFDEQWLAEFYNKLNIGFNDDYLKVVNSMKIFLTYKSFQVLALKDAGTVRDDFGGPPSIVNAWYQPEMNSITFPLGILQQPFYDINYPAAVNFGAMGVVAGHELTHGFDDEGVQWDGFGRLYNWIDPESDINFQQMADCVVTQYSQFSPTPNFTVDGRQTLGENMADNGGIRAAFNAFQAHESYWGPDPRLPDKVLDAFTQEQLFFLGFARVWCEINPTADRLRTQVLVDPHSPSQFRVLGTIQNFPAFRSAFNCPLGSKYAPVENNRCSVWASEVKSVTGIPPSDGANYVGDKVNNIDPPKKEESKPYQAVASRLKASVNITAKPCDNFYQYACGQYTQSNPTFVETAHAKVRNASLSVISTKPSDSDQQYLKLGKQFFAACKEYDTKDPKYATTLIKSAETLLNQQFPLFSPDPRMAQLDRTRTGSLLGSMWAVYNTDVLFSTNIKSLRDRYELEGPYAFHFDQPHLTFDRSWYTGSQAAQTRSLLTSFVKNVFTRYGNAASLNINEKKLNKDVENVVNYEFHLANDFLQNEYTRSPANNRTRLDLLKTVTTVNIDSFFGYIKALTGITDETAGIMLTQDVVFENPDYFMMLDKELKVTVANSKLRIFYNWIYYRLLQANEVFLPGELPDPLNKPPKIPVTRDEECTEALNWLMAPVYTRIAVDQLYGNSEKFKAVQKKVAEIADDVQHGFSTMLDALPWLSVWERKRAHSKVEAIVRNIGAPDFILDDTLLNKFYEYFAFSDPKDFVSIVLDLKTYARYRQINHINWSGIERSEFHFNQYTDPIWSAYELNSITFTLDVLQEPLYSPEFPSAVNFGLLGSLIGHEIGHSFDQNGINFNQFGQLQSWFDTTKPEYQTMLTCLNGQYGNYCSGTSGLMCKIDANATLNDNLADNTGLQAAIRGFRNWINTKGQDSRLPDDVLDQFTNEQLFFIGYAQQYCPKTDFQWYNLGAKQSPNELRLQGTLSNSQIFRSTFNCPVGQLYTPEKPCSVWESSNDNPELNVPKTATQQPNVNIPQNKHNESDAYKQCSDIIESSLDTRVDPCDDFYGYVCRRYEGPGAFYDVIYANQQKLINTLRDDSKDTGKLIAPAFERYWFRKCNASLNNWDSVTANAEYPAKMIAEVEQTFGIKFPLANDNPSTNPAVDAALFGKLIGYISRNYENVNIIFSAFVDSDYKEPETGYRLYIDTPDLVQDYTDYQEPKWSANSTQYILDWAILMKIYLSAVGSTDVSDNKTLAAAMDMVQFEYLIAQNIGPDPDGNDVDAVYNPMTVGDAKATYAQSLDLDSIFEQTAVGVEGLAEKLKDPNYKLIFQAPDNYKITTDNLQDIFANAGKVPNDAILNYIFFRLIYARQNYLPGASASYRNLYEKRKLPKGAPDVGIKRKPPKFPENDDHPIYAQYDYTRAEFLCSMALGDKFTQINNRLFVESVFPIEPIRNKTRENVAQFAEAVAVSFRAMINQLEWMEPESKKGAYDKLDLFVRNILYPNETFDDDFLNNFYSPLKTTSWDPTKDTSSFVDIQMIMGKFLIQKNLIPLASNKSASRTDFGDTSQVNAYYQPTANSITILSGITQPPFYHLDWPAAVNYGAIVEWHVINSEKKLENQKVEDIRFLFTGEPMIKESLVVGHEITHGFDNGGVLWDGIGAYKNWMDNVTQEAFNNMTHCIINEYSQFCRNKTNSNELQCIDGDLTQGENIADNGGIQSAYRAYRLHSDFYGEDPALPGKIAGKFTNDQLFFIGFTRTWCEYYYEPTEEYVWDDVHSPGPYRIEGSLRNFDGFRAAFNCPAKSRYSPNPDDEVNPSCKIWISDVKAHLEVPTRAPVPPNLNLPQPQEVTPGNVAYNNVSKYLSTLDVTQSPCDNFYEYACNKIQVTSNAQQINLDVAKIVSAALDSLDVSGAQDFYVPIKQYYDNCVKTLGSVPDGPTVTPFVTEFKTKTGITFPLFDGGDQASLTADQVGTALGYLSGTQAINTFVDVKVLKKFENVNVVPPKYILNIGEPVLTQPVDFYLDPAVSAMKDPIQDAFKAVLTGYRKAINKEATVKDDDIATAAEGLYLLELAIATKMRTFADRNNASLAETKITIGDLATSYPDVNWDKFFTEYGTNALDEVKGYFADKTYNVTVPNPDTLKVILPAILKDPSNQITATHLANYLNFRVIWDLATSLVDVVIDGSGDLPKIDDPKLAQKYICALETRELAPLHSKLYIDSFNKDQPATQNWREAATKIANGVIGALKSQVQQVEWLSPDIKKKAGDKFDNLTINVLFDNIITKPADLKNAYADYTPPDSTKENPNTVMAAFRVYVLKTELKLLQSTVTTIDRTAYLGSSSDPLPHYDALTNSLTIPASLATEPYFSDAYPLASNYGGLGYLIAHELAHSFDKFGIQFDALGKLQALLDTSTQAKFDGIATCLIDQYNSTCPLDTSYSPNCLDGVRRMDENIADNAGIHAAYSAYLAAANFNGEDPRLADPLLSQYTESQLFFLSYARDLCIKKQSDDQVYANIISGTNPPKNRIQNALQNYPAFQSAFNCPTTANYARKDRCNVWISDNSGTITQP